MTRIPITSVVAVTPSYGIGNAGTVPWACVGKSLKHDLAYFRTQTTRHTDTHKRNAVVTGRLTWESIPVANRPLRERVNFVVSSSLTAERVRESLTHTHTHTEKSVHVVDIAREETPFHALFDEKTKESIVSNTSQWVFLASSFTQCVDFINTYLPSIIEKIVVIGGSRLFEESLFHADFHTLHLTQVREEFPCDTFLTPKTIDFLEKQDLEGYVVEDNIVEDDVHYRIVEWKKQS